MREVGAEIRRLREARGWTGAQLAVYAGMAPSAVSQIETGKRSPNTGSLAKIAKALEVEVADLFPKAEAQLPLDFQANGGAAGPHGDLGSPTIAEELIDVMLERASRYRQDVLRPEESGTALELYPRFERDLMDRLLRLPKAEVAQACIDLARGYLCITPPATAPIQDSSKAAEALDSHEYAEFVAPVAQEAADRGVAVEVGRYKKVLSDIPRTKIASGRKVGPTKTPRKATRKNRAKEQ